MDLLPIVYKLPELNKVVFIERCRRILAIYMSWRSWKVRSIRFAIQRKQDSGIFVDRSFNGTGEIIALRRYNRYWIDPDRKIKNPLFGDFEKKVLDLKEMDARAIRMFAEELDPKLGRGFSICVVPSSDPYVKNNGISYVGRMLARNGRKDRVGFLIRHIKIQKLACGGDRSRKVHISSIRVSEEMTVEGEDVLLLDDIFTSGNSLLACRDILIANGARCVEMLALGRTGEVGINLFKDFYLDKERAAHRIGQD